MTLFWQNSAILMQDKAILPKMTLYYHFAFHLSGLCNKTQFKKVFQMDNNNCGVVIHHYVSIRRLGEIRFADVYMSIEILLDLVKC